METPFFSIIIPTYNRSNRIIDTLNSILHQKFENFELIIVDDGSTDDTKSLIISLQNPRIKYLFQENKERGAARNYGASFSKGKYLIFFDSDDLFYDNSLKAIHDHISESRHEVAYTPFHIITESGYILKDIYIKESLWRKYIIKDNFMGCNSVVIRADIFFQFQFNEDRDLTTMEDKELWLRVSSKYDFKFIPVYSHRMIEHHERSLNTISIIKKEKAIKSLIQSLSSDERFIRKYQRDAKIIFAREYALLSSLYSNIGNKNKAQLYLHKSFREYPLIVFTKRFIAAIKNQLFAFQKK